MEFDDQLFPKIEISYEPETRQISNEHQTQNLNSAPKKESSVKPKIEIHSWTLNQLEASNILCNKII